MIGGLPHPAVIGLRDWVDRLGLAFGSGVEITLYDLRHPDSSLIHRAGGSPGRRVRREAPNFLLDELARAGSEATDMFRRRSTTSDGRALLSSGIFIREGQEVVGAMCIDIDITPFEYLRGALDTFTASTDADTSPREEDTVGGLLDSIVDSVLASEPQDPARLTPEERAHMVEELDRRGVFLIKGAVPAVARRLSVSRFTVYGDLQSTRTRVPNQRHAATAHASRDESEKGDGRAKRERRARRKSVDDAKSERER